MSRMTRHAPSTNATQEVRVEDVLSCTELRPQTSATQTQEIRGIDIIEERLLGRDETPSIAPFEVDIAVPPVMSWPTIKARRAESTFEIDTRPPPARRLRMIVGGAMLLSVLILGGAGMQAALTSSPSSDVPRATTVLIRASEMTKSAPPRAASALVQAAIPSAPLAGTITLGPRARTITVDGNRLTPTTSLIVPCGEHVVRVGKDKAQTVDVPCGGIILLRRSSKAGR